MLLPKGSFAPCGFSSAELRSAKLNWRPVALSNSAAQPWTPATFGKAAKAFDTGLVCECLCFMPASGVFCIFFVMILKFDFRGNLLSSIDKLPKIWFNSTEDKRKRRGGFAYFGQK